MPAVTREAREALAGISAGDVEVIEAALELREAQPEVTRLDPSYARPGEGRC